MATVVIVYVIIASYCQVGWLAPSIIYRYIDIISHIYIVPRGLKLRGAGQRCVNKLPKVVTWLCLSWDSNL